MKNVNAIINNAAVSCPSEALVNFAERIEYIELSVKNGKLHGEYSMEDGAEIISEGANFVECDGWAIQPKHFSFKGMSVEETDKMVEYLTRTIEKIEIGIFKSDDGALESCRVYAKDVQGNKLEVEFQPIKDEEGKAAFIAALKKALLARCSAIVSAPKFTVDTVNKTFGGCGHLLIACEKVIWNF